MVLLWPLRQSGYLLGRDMVFTPHQPLNSDALGIGSAAPKAVPVDAIVALLEHVVGGSVLGRLAVIIPLLAAGWGLAALMSGAGMAARLAGVSFAVWNPYVIERLAIGQWALLWAYGALPWLVWVSVRIRRGGWPVWALVVPVAAASITPTGGLIAALVAVALVIDSRCAWPSRIWTLILTVALQAPWVFAGATFNGSSETTSAAARVFATRSENGGVLLTALGGGGIWNSLVVPDSRTGILSVLALLVVAAAAVPGWRRARQLTTVLPVLTWATGIGLLLALAGATPGLRSVVACIATQSAGGALLRDGQKWLLPLVVLEALLVAAAVDSVAQWLRARRLPAMSAALVLGGAVLAIGLLPDAAATLRPTFTPATYPSGWTVVENAVRGDQRVVVLPFQNYRAFAWTGGRPVLDPAPRLLPAPTVVDDELLVGGVLVPGQDAVAAWVGRTLRESGPIAAGLRADGVSWVLVELGTPGDLPNLEGTTLVYSDSQLRLYRVPDSDQVVRISPVRRAGAILALSLWWAIVVILVLAGMARGARKLLLSGK